mmetsp:Transcript_26197/g.66602  ORF Transcript_26197/g.66602 Transcript_26197/m.66602 type:complete len:201 (-) Transcript_26197:4139-4741(-)
MRRGLDRLLLVPKKGVWDSCCFEMEVSRRPPKPNLFFAFLRFCVFTFLRFLRGYIWEKKKVLSEQGLFPFLCFPFWFVLLPGVDVVSLFAFCRPRCFVVCRLAFVWGREEPVSCEGSDPSLVGLGLSSFSFFFFLFSFFFSFSLFCCAFLWYTSRSNSSARCDPPFLRFRQSLFLFLLCLALLLESAARKASPAPLGSRS